MPVIPTLNDTVALSSGSSFRASNTADAATSGANIAEALQGAGAELSREATVAQGKLNQIAVAKAMSAAQNVLNQRQTDLLNKTGENALGTAATSDTPAKPTVTQDFSQFAQTTHDSILAGLANSAQKQQFENWYGQVIPGMTKSVYVHEQKQFLVVHQTEQQSLADSTQSAVQSAIINGNYDQASISMRAGLGVVNDMGILGGTPPASVQEAQKKWVYTTLSNSVNQLIKDQRPGDAAKAIDYYKAHLSPDEVDELQSRVKPEATKVEARGIVSGILADPANLNPDGTPNVALVHQKIRDYYENQTKTVTTGGSLPSDPIYQLAQQVATALNGNPDVIYAQWAHESANFTSQLAKENYNLAGLTQITPNGEDNKQPDGANYYKQYSSFKEFADDYVNFIKQNDPDAVGKKTAADWVNALHQDKYFTDDPEAYLSSVQGILNNMPESGASTTQVSAPDYQGEAAALTFADSMIKDAQLSHKQQVTNTFNQLDSALSSGQISTYTGLKDYVDGLDLTATEKASAMAVGMQQLGVARTVTQWDQADAEQSAMRDLVEGNITNEDEFRSEYAGRLNWDRYASLRNSFLSKAKWATPANMATLDGAVRANNMTQTEKGMLMDIINQKAAEAYKEGRSLNSYDINDIANQEAAKVKSGWFSSIKKVDMPAGIIRTPSGDFVNSDGDKMEFDSATNTWSLKGN